MIKKLIATPRRKIILLTAVCFSMVVIGLGVSPNHSCACGDKEGTKLTYIIDKVSKKVFGKPIFYSKKTL